MDSGTTTCTPLLVPTSLHQPFELSKLVVCLQLRFSSARTSSEAPQFLGWILVRVKADLFPLVWVVSAANLQPPFSSPALRSLHGRPDRSGSLRSTDLQSPPLSLSRPHLANDEAHELYHGYACSESTSASLRPKTRLDLTMYLFG